MNKSNLDFRALFHCDIEFSARASGRINIIGEHIDYNGGCVLPMPTRQQTQVDLALRNDDIVQVDSTQIWPRQGPRSYHLHSPTRGRGWLDYIQGTTTTLLSAGHHLQGFCALIDSNVPVGSGLSSSAALEIALLKALREAFDLPIDDVELARFGQCTENDFVGAQVGIMDQMAASVGRLGSALFLNTRSLEYENILLPDHLAFVVINSGIAHAHAHGGYNQRRQECEAARALLAVSDLCSLGADALPEIARLPDPLRRRVRHVVTENLRVSHAVTALKQRDLRSLGELMTASHRSLQNDFEVSIPELDLLVEIALKTSGVYGARLTGGGFGGSVVILSDRDAADWAGKKISAQYQIHTGRHCEPFF